MQRMPSKKKLASFLPLVQHLVQQLLCCISRNPIIGITLIAQPVCHNIVWLQAYKSQKCSACPAKRSQLPSFLQCSILFSSCCFAIGHSCLQLQGNIALQTTLNNSTVQQQQWVGLVQRQSSAANALPAFSSYYIVYTTQQLSPSCMLLCWLAWKGEIVQLLEPCYAAVYNYQGLAQQGALALKVEARKHLLAARSAFLFSAFLPLEALNQRSVPSKGNIEKARRVCNCLARPACF